MKKKFLVAVLGSTGYVGIELVKILSKHPNVEINFLGSENSSNLNIGELDKNLHKCNLPLIDYNKNFNPINSEYVFLALPHGISNNFVKKYFNKIKIIDLSADFRLDNLNYYKKSYGDNHLCPNLLKEFIYGLPEINKEKLKNSKNIAIPGCYPTSILLPLIPLLKDNAIYTDNIIIDSKSGYSGAGKNFDLNNIQKNQDYNFYNYNTNEHRHILEIHQELSKHSNSNISFSFNPHILPNFRGMMSTIYCDLNNKINLLDIETIYKNFENKNVFIKFYHENRADFFSVQNTNNCIIKLFNHINDRKLIIVSLIDNLIKGAAGQAVQCFNISLNINENMALD